MTPDNRHVIGARIRAERQARALTQRELAELIRGALTGSQVPALETLVGYVKRWERGKTNVGPRYRAAYAAALEIPQQHLFATGDDAPVERRGFLSLTAAAAGLNIAPATLTSRTGQRIDMSTVEQLRRRTARLRRLDDVLGGADTYNVYASELSATRQLFDTATYREETGRALLGVLAEQAQQAGWAALDGGRMDAARSLFRDSMTAATEAGDAGLIGNSLALTAYQRVTTGRTGTEEADAACRVVDKRTPATVRALLHERAAWAHAVAGPAHRGEVEHALGQAAEALNEDAPEGPAPDWARWVDDVELQIMTGRCWSVLRRPDRAVPALTWALDRYDDAHARDKSLYLTWLAEAHIDADQVPKAARALGDAISLGGDVASSRPRKRVSEVVERLRPHTSTPAVAEVIDRAKTMSPA
ncbi:helix-turn-helix domain-containing protein [Actinomadura macra]|uniref:helix-turn-helix domain-containing protein n=1 Tax=Actinomadura macra TaxID=46164 RepID=UPI001C3F3C49|nr:helix-turn-helix transcriptional regulator [Actinomadura macra]